MSLRAAFKSKFKAGESNDSDDMVFVDAPSASAQHNTDEHPLTSNISQELYLSKLAELTDSLSEYDGQKEWPGSEKEVFEVQLSNLQEQLVAAMIENQTLSEEMQKYKKTSEVDRLQQELDYEQEKNKMLMEKFEAMESKNVVRGMPQDSVDGVELARDVLEDEAIKDKVDRVLKRKGDESRLLAWFVAIYYDFISDFTDPEEEEEISQLKEGDPLTVKKLKENIKRVTTCTKPILNFIKVVGVILHWRAPIISLIFFTVYMYSVWHGWLGTVLLGTLLYWLSKNYLTAKGWHVDMSILPYCFIEEDSDGDRVLGMSDKFQLVLQVARKVQNLLGKVADSLEKLKNLVMWEHPGSTRKLYFVLWLSFIASIFLPAKLLVESMGLFLGVKLFLISNIYRKFPKVKVRYDSVSRIWRELPTDAELIKRMQMAERQLYMLPPSPSNTSTREVVHGNRPSAAAEAVLSSENQAFCQLFSLPPSEAPLSDWQGGKRCTLISKEKTLTGAFKNGKLFLTRSFLCFERSKNPTPKNVVIPLTDITALEKAKPYGFLPGGGMAIEITVSGTDKPYLFGAMINRDEAYESIIRTAQQACLAWAMDDEDMTTPQTSTFDS